MMGRKRKASLSIATNFAQELRRKKWRDTFVLSSSEDDDSGSTELGDGEWPINRILDESDSKYLIDWEGHWSPTWEPKDCANDVAIQVWEAKKTSIAQLDTEPFESFRPGTEAWDRESEQSQSPYRSFSPLFVPFDSVPETEPSTRDQTPSINPAESNFSSGRGSATGSREASSPITPSSNKAFVLDPGTTSSIPAEFLLRDETSDFALATTQITHISDSLVLSAHGEKLFQSIISSHLSNDQEHQESAPHGSINIERPTNPSAQVDEIAETPSTSLKSPWFRDDFWHTSAAIDLQLDLSQVSGQPPCESSSFTPAGTGSLATNTNAPASFPPRSVPETIYSEHSQSSANHYSSIFRTPSKSARKMEEKKEILSPAAAMEKYSHIEGSTPREKMRNAFAQLRAKSTALQSVSDSATPSSAGDIEPVSASVPETTAPLSVRVDKEPVPHTTAGHSVPPTDMVQTIQPSALSIGHIEEAPPGSVRLGLSEFAITLPMDSRIKSDYDNALDAESRNIRDFLNSFGSSQIQQDERQHLRLRMQRLETQLNNITTHPDLNIAAHLKDPDSDLEKVASWAEYSSAKFLFLGYLVELASNQDLHLVVMVEGGKTLDVMERYLLGKGFAYTRPREEMGTNIEVSMAKGPLSFGIHSSQKEVLTQTYKAPSAIIALDAYFEAKSPSVEHMRTTYARHGHLLPVIRLIVSNTCEHISRCLPTKIEELQRLRLLFFHINRLRDVVGDLQDDALGVREDAEEIFSYLLSDNFDTSWSLPLIEPLQIASPDELDAAAQNQSEQPNRDSAPFPAPAIQKRQFETDDAGESSSKRPRMGTQDASQFTEQFPSQTLGGDLQALERSLIEMRSAHAAELERLQGRLNDALSQLRDRDQMIETFQHRYESRTSEVHQLRQERDKLAESKVASEQRIERQKEEITKLKDERTQLKHDLEAAREALKSSGGSVAELETAHEEIRRLSQTNASLERKAEYEKNQAEYTREQYQTASTVAAQAGIELRQLRSENEDLKRRTEVDAARLKELNMKTDQDRHLSRIAELEATLASREDLLRRKEDELREIRKNRPSTRSTSTQPRSPKWANNSRPTSPGINNNNNNNGAGIGGRGSTLRFSSEMSL